MSENTAYDYATQLINADVSADELTAEILRDHCGGEQPTADLEDIRSAMQSMAPITAEQYWTAVLGARSALQVVEEFELVASPAQGPGSIDEWLGESEAAAVAEATDGWPTLEMLAPHHEAALAELMAAAEVAS